MIVCSGAEVPAEETFWVGGMLRQDGAQDRSGDGARIGSNVGARRDFSMRMTKAEGGRPLSESRHVPDGDAANESTPLACSGDVNGGIFGRGPDSRARVCIFEPRRVRSSAVG